MIAVYRGRLNRRDFLKLGGAEAILTTVEKHEQPAERPVTEHGGFPEECSLRADGTEVRR